MAVTSVSETEAICGVRLIDDGGQCRERYDRLPLQGMANQSNNLQAFCLITPELHLNIFRVHIQKYIWCFGTKRVS